MNDEPNKHLVELMDLHAEVSNLKDLDPTKLNDAAADLLDAADFALNVLLDNCLSDGREVSREKKVEAQMKLRLALRKAGLKA
jgi:hypothetical protein